MAELPAGTVTFLFTDIESSTALWEREPAAMQQAAARHDALIEAAVAEQGGVVVRPRGEGDSRFAVFARASDAVAAALALQWDFAAEPWPTSTPLRVRLALHTGEAELRDGDYYGTAVNRCARLRAVAHGGQALVSQATVELVGDRVPPPATLLDLGEHRLRDLVRPERVYQLVQPGVPSTFPALRSLDAYPHNLPLQLTSFVGREQELTEITNLLATARLVTLTGVGGGGKTRLALQVAADVIDAYPDGVWFVDLAPLTDPELVARTVAGVLGIVEQPGQAIEATLLAALRTRRLLLILDNCEHLLDACAALTEALLQGCPSLRLLATSREALGSAGEVPWRIPSLVTPDPDHLPPLDELVQAAAVRLFVERARVVRPAFAVTDQNAAAVARVCWRLDGIPLALELAAARLSVLTTEQIAARLDDRFRLLTGGRRTALRRQQTLAAALDWSYDLLTEPERVLLRQLAVFAGGFTLDAAEAVATAEGRDTWQVLDLLTQLVAKSLVVVEAEDAAARYWLLETVRQYAGEKLAASGEAAAVRDRHREYFLALAEAVEPALWGPDQSVWLDRVDTEHDNLRAALAWCLESAPSAGLRLAASLYGFWAVRGHLSESQRWLTDLLSLEPGPTAARARALVMAGKAAREHAGLTVSRRLLEESLAISRALGDRAGQAYALNELAGTMALSGDFTQVEALLEEGLALARAVDDSRRVRSILTMLGGQFTLRGDLGRARALLTEAVARDRQAGDTGAMALSLYWLGHLTLEHGDLVGAAAALQEGLALYQAVGDRVYRGSTLALLGVVSLLTGDPVRARSLLEEARTVARTAGSGDGMSLALWGLGRLASAQGAVGPAAAAFRDGLDQAHTIGRRDLMLKDLEGLALVAMEHGRPPRAARLLGAATAWRMRHGPPLPPVDRPAQEHLCQRVKAALGEVAFASAWAEGEALALEEAVAEALAEEPIG